MSHLTLVAEKGLCTNCGQKACDCWITCGNCGTEKFIGQECPNQKNHAYIYASRDYHCVCSIPFALRKECGDARRLKTPCRCFCHTKENREARVQVLKERSVDNL